MNKKKTSRWQAGRAGWGKFLRQLAPGCGNGRCVNSSSLWRRMRRRSRGVRLQGARYCRTECLELALTDFLARPVSRRGVVASHRIPLGLLLLSRQQLTAEQLRAALAAQRSAGQGKIGAWLLELGFASESQVTAALARQWRCPVLLSGANLMDAGRLPAIPALLLESFQMMPVELVEATGTLLVAFSERIDYTVLYAIEQMLGYRTEACLTCPSTLQKKLQALAPQRGSSDIIFERMDDPRECARIIGNYSAKLGAVEVLVARCGEHLWIRLERLRQEAVNLVLSGPAQASGLPTFLR
jgi:hypothetical protein